VDSAAEPRELAETISTLLGRPDRPFDLHVEAIEGGRNNRVFRVDGVGKPLLLKSYFSSETDRRDRYAAEHGFYDFLESCGSEQTPKPVAWDPSRRLGLFSFIEGRKLDGGEIDESAVDTALSFFSAINQCRDSVAAKRLGDASEACFSVEAHLSLVNARLERIRTIAPNSALSATALSFVRDRLMPAWVSVRESVREECKRVGISPTRELSVEQRCISPSDFGFHNAIRRDDGHLVFFDFEYAGWDDPAKLVSDFFCQQQKPVPLIFRDRVVKGIAPALGDSSGLAARAALLLPVYQVKWCCIILNDFLTADSARRSFAERSVSSDDRRSRQLAAAERLLDRIEVQPR
jgi:hypothetical protein